VPAGGTTTLSFWHLMRCRDAQGGGELAAFIADANGDMIDTVYDTCATDKDWTQENYDLSPLAGQTIYVAFYSYSVGFYSPQSWQYIDGVSVTNPEARRAGRAPRRRPAPPPRRTPSRGPPDPRSSRTPPTPAARRRRP